LVPWMPPQGDHRDRRDMRDHRDMRDREREYRDVRNGRDSHDIPRQRQAVSRDDYVISRETSNRYALPSSSSNVIERRQPASNNNRSDGAWRCKLCGGSSHSHEEPCGQCGATWRDSVRAPPSKMFRPPPQRERGDSSQNDEMERAGDSSSRSKGTTSSRSNDWACANCTNMNWEWRTQCNRCHACRDPEEIAELERRARRGGSRSRSRSNDKGGEKEVDDLVAQRLRKRLSTHPAGVFKDSDWVCVGCGNINWDWRTKCHQCQSGKPLKGTGVPLKGPPSRKGSSVDEDMME